MNSRTDDIAELLNDCWNRIGVWSNSGPTCERLVKYIHCRNCDHYAASGREILNRPVSAEYRDAWTERFAKPVQRKETGAHSVLLFRLGDEWLGLKSANVNEITPIRRIHSLPHRSNDIIKGLVNIRGELKLCISIGTLLQLDRAREAYISDREIHERMIYVAHGSNTFVFPVSEVHGIHHFSDSELEPVPLTVARSKHTFTTNVLPWKEHHVGILDHELLFYALETGIK